MNAQICDNKFTRIAFAFGDIPKRTNNNRMWRWCWTAEIAMCAPATLLCCHRQCSHIGRCHELFIRLASKRSATIFSHWFLTGHVSCARCFHVAAGQSQHISNLHYCIYPECGTSGEWQDTRRAVQIQTANGRLSQRNPEANISDIRSIKRHLLLLLFTLVDGNVFRFFSPVFSRKLNVCTVDHSLTCHTRNIISWLIIIKILKMNAELSGCARTSFFIRSSKLEAELKSLPQRRLAENSVENMWLITIIGADFTQT